MKVTLTELKKMIKEQMRRQSMSSRNERVKRNAVSKINDLLQSMLDELGEFQGGADDRDVAEIEKHVKVIVRILAKIAARAGVPPDMIPQTYKL